MLWGKQQREPFAQGNNWLGRVTWNVSYRLLALAKMLDTEPRWELRQRLRHICTAILANIEKADQFATKKYSIDGVSKLHIAVDDALIGLSLMRALSWLPLEEANAVHRFAQEIIAEHEFTWRRGMYFFPKGSRFEFDGIVQPFNQQHALGLLIIELAKKNGEPRYYARVSEMLDAFLGETVMHEGVRLWSYWPKAFYAGWKAEDHLSVNTPTRAPAPDVWFDDTSHGAIVAAFAEEAATLLGKPRPLDIGGIVRRVQSGPFQFYRFMIGAGRQQEASLSWLPPGRMAQSPVLAATYRRWLPRPWVDFDNQDLMESYAVAASAATASGSITIRRLVVGEQMTFAPAIEVSANGGQCTLEEAAGQPERNELCGDILSSVWRSRP
jgi:hypothetical protein